MPEGKLGKIWFSGTFCYEETICIVMSIHLSAYLEVCALGAKGKMNNVQAWIPEGLGQRRQMSARPQKGPTTGPDMPLPLSVSYLYEMGSPFCPCSLFLDLEWLHRFWTATSVRKIMHILRWDKIGIAFRSRS